jgi:hypothetical protein
MGIKKKPLKDKDALLALGGVCFQKVATLRPHQWAWLFARMNAEYGAVQPAAFEKLAEIEEAYKDKLKPEGPHPFIEEFSQTQEFLLINQFGLIYPLAPAVEPHEAGFEIWDPKYVLDGMAYDRNDDYSTQDLPEGSGLFEFSLHRPRYTQGQEFDRHLQRLGCAEHITHLRPMDLLEYAEVYVVERALTHELGRKPNTVELGQILYPQDWFEIAQVDPNMNADLKRSFMDKPRHARDQAAYYVDQRGYLDLLRWEPDQRVEDKFRSDQRYRKTSWLKYILSRHR